MRLHGQTVHQACWGGCIGKHDADLKINQIRGFLKKNYHVTVSINNPKSYRAHSHAHCRAEYCPFRRPKAVEAINSFQVRRCHNISRTAEQATPCCECAYVQVALDDCAESEPTSRVKYFPQLRDHSVLVVMHAPV